MKSVKVQVPGKILLAGEYAVLDGHPALSFAVDRYLTVTLTEQSDRGWILQSDLWPQPRSLDAAAATDIASEPLLQVAEFAQDHFALRHAHCQITSELDISFGLGSSTALRLGVLLAAAALSRHKTELSEDLVLEAAALSYRMQLAQQSFASGYDGLTQALGGLILWTPDYQNWPGQSMRKLDAHALASHLQIFVGGAGAPTKQVGTSVRKVLAENALQSAYYAASDQVIHSWLQVLKRGLEALPELCQCIAAHRRLFSDLPYFPKQLFRILGALPGFDQTWTVKTTGAGGEDALLLIGKPEDTVAAVEHLAREGWSHLPVNPADQGARLLTGTAL